MRTQNRHIIFLGGLALMHAIIPYIHNAVVFAGWSTAVAQHWSGTDPTHPVCMLALKGMYANDLCLRYKSNLAVVRWSHGHGRCRAIIGWTLARWAKKTSAKHSMAAEFCETHAVTSPETVLNANSVKTKLYNTPSPYFIVLASSIKISDVKAIEFHRVGFVTQA